MTPGGHRAHNGPIRLHDRIDVHAPLERFDAFFVGMSQARYLRWHPDRRVFRWTRGQSLRVGDVFYFEEIIAGKRLCKSVVFTRLEPGRHIAFAPTFWLMRLLLPRLIFRAEHTGAGAFTFIAEIVIRTGPIGAWLNRREFNAARTHMRVEGENFKRWAEATPRGGQD